MLNLFKPEGRQKLTSSIGIFELRSSYQSRSVIAIYDFITDYQIDYVDFVSKFLVYA